MNAVDTNVFVYSVDVDEPSKRTNARELLQQFLVNPPETILLWQVIGEFLNCLRRWERQGRISAADVEDNIRDVLTGFPIALPTTNIIPLSLSLSSRYSLSHWDSMLIAACVEAGVDRLYSEDLDDGMTYDSVTIANPFA